MNGVPSPCSAGTNETPALEATEPASRDSSAASRAIPNSTSQSIALPAVITAPSRQNARVPSASHQSASGYEPGTGSAG
jgi:hypothetical protein